MQQANLKFCFFCLFFFFSTLSLAHEKKIGVTPWYSKTLFYKNWSNPLNNSNNSTNEGNKLTANFGNGCIFCQNPRSHDSLTNKPYFYSNNLQDEFFLPKQSEMYVMLLNLLKDMFDAPGKIFSMNEDGKMSGAFNGTQSYEAGKSFNLPYSSFIQYVISYIPKSAQNCTSETENVETVKSSEAENVETVESSEAENVETVESSETENAGAVKSSEAENVETVKSNETENVETVESSEAENVETVESSETENAGAVKSSEAENVEVKQKNSKNLRKLYVS